MILNNVSFCRYLADTDFSWCQENWDVSKIVRAIKGESFKGYTSLRIGGALQRLDSEHRQVATDWFVDRVGQTSLARDEYILCPIPDSQCTPSSSHTPRTLVLARELRKRFPQLKVWPNLKFNKPMAKKIRNEEVLYQNMVCPASVPPGHLILLDDVCTTGAHARAAQRRLIQSGAKHMTAMSVTRTIVCPEAGIFGFRSDPL
jgi:hypothetical protein